MVGEKRLIAIGIRDRFKECRQEIREGKKAMNYPRPLELKIEIRHFET